MASNTDTESYVRLRVRMFWVGVWSTYLLCAAQLAWLLTSFDQPNRPIMVAIVGAGVGGTFVLSRLPIERIVRSRHREVFFLSWSVADVVMVTAAAILDGGARSPMVGTFFLTIVYAALSYPLRSVALLGVLNVVAFVATGTLGGTDAYPTSSGYVWIFAASLAVVAAQCVYQARIHDDLRAELARLSGADPLTGALNRRGFGERVDAALSTAARERTGVALLVLDLDRFKALNDSQGHEAGDALLRHLVTEARAAVRGQDAVGRLGGDEFAVLLPGSDANTAMGVAERIADALPAEVGISYGIATVPEDGMTGELLHRRADERLYAHKREHRLAVALAA